MTNRTTKRALLTSVMALLLCFSMLLGTTYAWFTDSVTSSNNIIKSGNLDVAMYWADGTVDPANATWTDASTGAIFNYDLWEPGYAEVRHIKIANEGNLALKYKVNILANGEVSKLSDVIDVYYVDPAVQVADRALLTDSMKLGTLTDALANLSQTGFGTLEAGAKDEITIAFKMQETAGNEYQGLSIGTDFAIQILATQLEYEEDSFDNQYDKDATHPSVGKVVIDTPVATETVIDVVDEDVVDDAGNNIVIASVTLPANAEAGAYEFSVNNVDESKDQAGNDVLSFDLELTKDGVKVEDDGQTVYAVSYYIGLNKNLGAVLHKGQPVANAVYDANTGYVDFTVSGFSPFEIISYTSLITTAEELAENLAKGGTFVLANDIDLAGIDWTPAGTADEPFSGIFDGNGYTISNLTVKGIDYASFIAYADAETVIRNVNLVNVNIDSTKHAAGVVLIASEGVELENVSVSGNIKAASYAGGIIHNAANAVIKDCVNYADVSANRAGGIGAWLTVNANIDGVVNYGNVYGAVGASGIVHGFAGSVKNAVNYGTVKSANYEAAAGIAGVQKNASTYEYCTNYGKVTSTYDDPNASAAGILGQTAGTAATIKYCANFGDITAEASYAAGIAYSLYGSINASYCYNGGDVNGADGAGAIAPKPQYGATEKVSYCMNTGNIESENGVVYIASVTNESCYDLSTGTLVEIGKGEVALADALAALNGGTDSKFFGADGVPAGANVVVVCDADELEAALKGAADGAVIVLANDITVEKDWDARYTGGKLYKTVTIDGAGNTLKIVGKIADNNQNAIFRFEADATVKNLTVDITEATGYGMQARAISAKYGLVVDNCTFIGNPELTNTRAIIYGEGQAAAQFDAEVSVTNSKFINWKRGVTDNENAKDIKSVVVSGNSFENASLYVSVYEKAVVTDNTIVAGEFDVRTYSKADGSTAIVTGNVLANGYKKLVKNFANVTAQADVTVE